MQFSFTKPELDDMLETAMLAATESVRQELAEANEKLARASALIERMAKDAETRRHAAIAAFFDGIRTAFDTFPGAHRSTTTLCPASTLISESTITVTHYIHKTKVRKATINPTTRNQKRGES